MESEAFTPKGELLRIASNWHNQPIAMASRCCLNIHRQGRHKRSGMGNTPRQRKRAAAWALYNMKNLPAIAVLPTPLALME